MHTNLKNIFLVFNKNYVICKIICKYTLDYIKNINALVSFPQSILKAIIV